MLELGKPDDSRRGFIRGSSLLLAGAIPTGLASAAGLEQNSPTAERTIRVGLIGCGGRGMALANQLLGVTAGPTVRITALADAFADRVQQTLRALRGRYPDRVVVENEHRFSGLESYRELLQTDVDLVLLAAPPTFRPLHFEAAVAATKHIFAEKPIAVDVPGVKRFLAANERAGAQNLVVGVGWEPRCNAPTRSTVEQLHAGAVGQIVFARAHSAASRPIFKVRHKSQSELENQLRNWQHFQWTSGDSMVEQHVQNLDVINWILRSHPSEAQGVGGRNPLVGQNEGDVFDHHCVEYTYRDGTKLLSICEQRSDCGGRCARLSVHGTQGWCDITAGKIYNLSNELIWQAVEAPSNVGHDAARLLAAIASGATCNETAYACESTLTAILGRMATWCGRAVTWSDCINSSIALRPTLA